MAFKDYNGNTITLTHTHVPKDTQRNGEIALATTTEAGFMSKADRVKLTNLGTRLKNNDPLMDKEATIGSDVLNKMK